MWVANRHVKRCSTSLVIQFSSLSQSCPTLCDPMDCSTPGCPSPTPGVHSNSCPLSWWCHPTILSSVIPFSSCLQSFLALGSFQMSQFFASGGQSIGVVQWYSLWVRRWDFDLSPDFCSITVHSSGVTHGLEHINSLRVQMLDSKLAVCSWGNDLGVLCLFPYQLKEVIIKYK